MKHCNHNFTSKTLFTSDFFFLVIIKTIEAKKKKNKNKIKKNKL